MFKRLTKQEQIRAERSENAKLLVKNQQLEEAVLELASIISENMEAQDGEIISEQN